MVERSKGGAIIDTPGIRELIPANLDLTILDRSFPDFLPWLGQCSFSSCSHTHEPGCLIKQKVEDHIIHEDRYETYLRLFHELER